MAALPPKSCALCRVAEKINNNMRKHILVYSIFYLLVFEIGSIFLRNLNNYALFWYPLLTNIALATIFYNLWLFRERLKFCFRKKIAVFSLFLYYIFAVATMVFNLCNSTYTQVISYGLLSVVLLTLISTIYAKKYGS